jgi:nitrate/nitrite transporter NarK
MLSVLVPLYGVAVGLNPAQIGLIVAARSVLPATLSIHGGILMDQLGTQRVLLWVAGACATLPVRAAIAARTCVEPQHGGIANLEHAHESRGNPPARTP